MARDVVIIDYGHGGVFNGRYQTIGKQYLYEDREPQVWVGEGLINRCIAVRLMRMLRQAGVDCYDAVAGRWEQHPLTWMELQQLDVPLSTRAAAVNNIQREYPGAPLVSIHSNALSSSSAGPGQSHGGVSVWTSPGETKSDGLADAIWTALRADQDAHGFHVGAGDASDGDADYEADFHILTRTIGVAVLIEGGFFDNWEDCQRLMSRSGQRLLARSYANGILRWLTNQRRVEVADDGLAGL